MATSGQAYDRAWVIIDGRRIAAVGQGPAPSLDDGVTATVDLGDSERMVPGFVDVHIHGGGGYEVGGDSVEKVAIAVGAVARHHVRHGTTAMVATTVSDSASRLAIAAAGVAEAIQLQRPGDAAILGLHLEGPWLAPTRAGAHSATHLRLPDMAELESLYAASAGSLRLVTVAPELDGALDMIAAGRSLGVTMAVGHTEADFDTVRTAFEVGAGHVTHLGNAMPGIDRRAPGPIGAAMADAWATVEVIADGVHLHPGFVALVAGVVGPRLVAVTDATAACGLHPGHYRLGPVDVVVDNDRVVVADDPEVLAGSILTMDRAVGRLVGAGVDLPSAILAATGTPAAVVSAPTKGHLRAGADADLVVLDADLRAVATIIAGQVAWDPSGRFAASQPRADRPDLAGPK